MLMVALDILTIPALQITGHFSINAILTMDIMDMIQLHLKYYLKYADGHTPFFIAPESNPIFDPEPMKDISNWVQTDAKNFIFIYGGNDPWSSTGVCLTGRTNSIKMIQPSGSHRTRIKSFSEKDKKIIYSKLEEWLNIKIE